MNDRVLIEIRRWVMEGKPAKMHINRFQWYFKHGAAMDIDAEEVECLVANMIASVRLLSSTSRACWLIPLLWTESDQGVHLAQSPDRRAVKGPAFPLVRVAG